MEVALVMVVAMAFTGKVEEEWWCHMEEISRG